MSHKIIFIENTHRFYGIALVVSTFSALTDAVRLPWKCMSLYEHLYDVFMKHYTSNWCIMTRHLRLWFFIKICIFILQKNQHLKCCHYLFHFLYRSQNKYTRNLCQHPRNHEGLLRWSLRLLWKIFLFLFHVCNPILLHDEQEFV